MVTITRNRVIMCIVCVFLFCVGITCYFGDRGTTERGTDIRRIQSSQQQLESATEQLDEAVRENQSARNVATDSIIVNDRIEQSINRSTSAVEQGKAANTRTSAAVSEAQRIITDAKSTAAESERIISDSKRILERAQKRTEISATGREKK